MLETACLSRWNKHLGHTSEKLNLREHMIDTIGKIAKNFRVEIKKYIPGTSYKATLHKLLQFHEIDLVLDVGANVGQYYKDLRFAGYDGKLISFEPLSAAYSKLVDSSKNDPNWIIAPQMALGNYDGEIEINVSANSVSSSVLKILEKHVELAPNSKYISSEKVKISRLDTIMPQYLNDHKNIYLKIDTQGYEKQVLDGATNLLEKVHGLQIELSFVPLYDGQMLFTEMVNFIVGQGFEIHAIFPSFTDMDSGRMFQVDGVFIKKTKS